MRDYVGTSDGMAADGLRVTIVRGVPSPWGEVVKGVLHVKNIDWQPVSFDGQDKAQIEWTGQVSAPTAVYGDEAPLSSVREIVALAERLAPTPALLPEDKNQRALVLQMGEDLMGEGGLAWSRRLQLVHYGMTSSGGFSGGVAAYLAAKYGYVASMGETYGPRVVALLREFSEFLANSEGPYLFGDTMTAADIQLACVMALFAPLPDNVCPMHEKARASFETLDGPTKAALAPNLLAHRDHMYANHLELPLQL
ncbi:glutathione S-transferase [Shimia isoporae]|uniref:Glutathione S-transferase n=1 Tax=Shimia isoporae TaxID=647720 RepID=A0A4R1NK37_9RHOB|nr:glutathione S-transferase family protein [Shimia isoporae]TCL08415.1 glutathione S-transferase [Shimia isoporae]